MNILLRIYEVVTYLQAQVEYFLVATWLHNFWGLHLASFDFLRSPPECRELILGGTDLRVCLEQHKWRSSIFRNYSGPFLSIKLMSELFQELESTQTITYRVAS